VFTDETLLFEFWIFSKRTSLIDTDINYRFQSPIEQARGLSTKV